MPSGRVPPLGSLMTAVGYSSTVKQSNASESQGMRSNLTLEMAFATLRSCL
jgi:hypothetical protein